MAAALTPALAQAPAWRVSAGEVAVRCPLTVGGSFEATTSAVSGQLTADPSRPSALAGEVTVDLKSLDTGIGLRNTHMRDKYLEVGRGAEFERAVLSEIALDSGDVASFSGSTAFTGTLLVHGTRKQVKGRAKLSRSGDIVRIDAEFPVRIPEHGIATPRYLGVGVADEVQVKVKLTAAAGPPPSGRRRGGAGGVTEGAR